MKKAGNVSKSVKKKKGNRKLPKLSGKVVCMLVVVFLVAGVGVWQYVEKQVIEPKRATRWMHYTENGKVGFKDTKGKVKLKAKYSNVGTFSSNGLTKVVGENHLWGYMNCHGKMVIEAKFEGAGDFADNGLACAQEVDSELYGYINEKGTFEIEETYEDAGAFTENGLAYACLEEGKYGYIDSSGKFVLDAKYGSAENFEENGLARVSDENGKEFYINAQGKKVKVEEN